MKDLFFKLMLLSMALIFFLLKLSLKQQKISVNVYLHESVTDLFVNAQDQPNCANFARRIFEQVCYYALLR